MAYNIDTSKATLPEALELLADAVLNPKLHAWEVAEQVRRRRCCRRGMPLPRPAVDGRTHFGYLGASRFALAALQWTGMSCSHCQLADPRCLQVTKMEADVKGLKDNPQTTLLEGLHSVAYNGGLGRPLIVPDGCLSGLSAGGRAGLLATG